MTARLAVRVQPGAKQTGLVGRADDGVLRIRVTEPPEDGRANRAVEKLVAELLGVAQRQVTVVRGTSARSKWIEVAGLTPAELVTRVDAALAQNEERNAQ